MWGETDCSACIPLKKNRDNSVFHVNSTVKLLSFQGINSDFLGTDQFIIILNTFHISYCRLIRNDWLEKQWNGYAVCYKRDSMWCHFVQAFIDSLTKSNFKKIIFKFHSVEVLASKSRILILNELLCYKSWIYLTYLLFAGHLLDLYMCK